MHFENSADIHNDWKGGFLHKSAKVLKTNIKKESDEYRAKMDASNLSERSIYEENTKKLVLDIFIVVLLVRLLNWDNKAALLSD